MENRQMEMSLNVYLSSNPKIIILCPASILLGCLLWVLNSLDLWIWDFLNWNNSIYNNNSIFYLLNIYFVSGSLEIFSQKCSDIGIIVQILQWGNQIHTICKYFTSNSGLFPYFLSCKNSVLYQKCLQLAKTFIFYI